MMSRIINHLRLIVAASAMLLSFTAPALQPVMVSAAGPVDVLEKCDNKSKVCQGTNANSLTNLLKNVVNILLYVGGIIAVLMIIVGGIRYSTSGGDAGQTKSARDTIVYAVVGLVIAIMSFAIVNFVLTRI